MPSPFQHGSSSKAGLRGGGHQFSEKESELASILARPRGNQNQVTNDGVRVFVDLSKHTIVNFVDLVAQQHAQRALARKKEAKLAKKQQHAKRIVEVESDAMDIDPTPEEGATAAAGGGSAAAGATGGTESTTHSEMEGEDVGESVGESDNSDNSENSDDSNDDDGENPPPKKDFLDNLMDRFEKLYYVLDEEDEEERRAIEEGRPQKKRSRWDFESYDMNDDFIDDSEAMVQSMGIKLRPKESGFYVCRGPIVMVPAEEPSAPRKRGGGGGGGGGGRRKAPATTTTTAKGSNLAIVESAIEWASEVSESERKLSGKSNGEGSSTVPKKKRTTKAKGAATDDIENDAADTNNDSDKQTKAPAPKRTKAKTAKTLAAAALVAAAAELSSAASTTTSTPPNDSSTPKPTTTSKASTTTKTKTAASAPKPSGSSPPSSSTAAIPVVTVDSPPPVPMDGMEEGPSSQPPPSRPVSPLKSKSKPKSKASALQQDHTLSTDAITDDALTEDDANQDSHLMDTRPDPVVVDASNEATHPAVASDRMSTSRSPSPLPSRVLSLGQGDMSDDDFDTDDQVTELGPRPEEPLPDEVMEPFKVIEDLASQELWEANIFFPRSLRTPLLEFVSTALECDKGSIKVVPELFFQHLQSVLPFSISTMKKIAYRALLPNWIKERDACRITQTEELRERVHKIWKDSGMASQSQTEDADGEANHSSDEGGIGKPPQKKFPWNQQLRMLLWEIMEKIMEVRQLRHELHLVKKTFPAPPSDSKTRKDSYQQLLHSFPEGSTTSYEISRQYSQLKEKLHKKEKADSKSDVSNIVLTAKAKAVIAANALSRQASKAIVTPTAGPSNPTVKMTKSNSSTKLTAASASTSSPTIPAETPTAVTSSSSPLLTTTNAALGVVPRAHSPPIARRASPSPEPMQSLIQQIQQTRQTQSQQQSAPRAHFSYTGGPMSSSSAASSLNKKRKNSDGAAAQGSGSSIDPLVIGGSPTQEQDSGYNRRRSPQGYYRDTGYPSQVSYSSSDIPGRNTASASSSVTTNKKAKAAAGDYGDYGGQASGTSGSGRGMESMSSSGHGRSMGGGGGRAGGVHDGPGYLQQQQQPSSTMRRSYSPPPLPMHQQPPTAYQSRQPQSQQQHHHYSHHDSPDMQQYHHHRRPPQHEMSGGGLYSSPQPTSSSSIARRPGGVMQQRPPPPHQQRLPDDHLRHPGPHRPQQPPPPHYRR
ncbi:hypothetical protein BGX23_005395 [Mortierella sp. AD031]|nr:hypothetical protein BGX23_005395 [Mortierella sp. AD031]